MNRSGTPVSTGTPAAEFDVDVPLVAGLLADQHPDLAHLPLQSVDAGWDNAILRLGDELSVRLPRRSAAAPLIVHEQTWLPRIAGRLTLPVPVPYRTGEPGRGYPWRWSVVPWLSGTAADLHEPDASQARVFGAFLRSLHVAAPAGAPANPLRGVPLADRANSLEERMRRLSRSTGLIVPEIERMLSDAIAAPIDIAPTWIHGDLHSRNVLVECGVITGVIDWGDMAAGDPATDLASVWMLFADPSARRNALESYGELSGPTLRRARGWAVFFGLVLLDAGLINDPRLAAIGERALRRVAEGE